MWLLPVLILNVGFSFLASIELHWNERGQDETAQQELEALTSSSAPTYRLNRLAGQIAELIDQAVKSGKSDDELQNQLAELGQKSFAPIFLRYKLHVFRKNNEAGGYELFYALSERVESKRAMAMVFNHLVEQHQGVELPTATIKQRDKFSESYFGKTMRSQALANSKKGRSTFILHDGLPHWFIWDYHEKTAGSSWGYLVAAEVSDEAKNNSMQQAIKECGRRGSGIGGFIPMIDPGAKPILAAGLQRSRLFEAWRQSLTLPGTSRAAKAYWLRNGAPAPALIGNYKVYSHFAQSSDYLTVFVARRPVKAGLPLWLKIMNFLTSTILVLLTLRGLILNRWLEPRLTLRFLILYFLAATFPLGLLGSTAAAYQYQTARSEQNQIADQLDACLNQIESRKLQFQDEYKHSCSRLFADEKLSEIIAAKGFSSPEAQERVLASFNRGGTRLPLIGFYLLDLAGNGREYTGEPSSLHRLRDIFTVYRAPIIENLRKKVLKSSPGIILPDFKVSEEDRFGAQAFGSLSGSTLADEIEKFRNFCLSQQSGQVTATIMYDFIKVTGQPDALLFVVWDDGKLFEKSIGVAIDGFKQSNPEFSFIAFSNKPQGLRTFYRRDNDDLGVQAFSGASDVAETAAARGGTVRKHLPGLTVVAMPYGRDSEYVISGIGDHRQIRADEARRQRNFVLLTIISLLIAALSAWFMSAFLLQPITGLKKALDCVSEGDYSINLDSSRSDELGKLTGAFAQMVDGLKERQRLSSLLSDHAVEALAKSSSVRPDSETRVFEGVALVSDIRSFTTLCEKWPTDEITAMLNHHIAAMAEAITISGGRIYKFIGDAIEAVFEAEEPGVAALNALTASVRMNAALKELNRRRSERGLFTYAFGVGLAYGHFYAGSVGSDDTRLDYSIIGENFHRAAQLEALTKVCPDLPIIFDPEIARLLAGRIDWVAVPGEAGAMTFSAGDSWHLEGAGDGPVTSALPEQKQTAAKVIIAETKTALARDFRPMIVFITIVLVLLIGMGVNQGVVWRDQLANKTAMSAAREQNFRLTRQIAAENASVSAFEGRLSLMIKNMEAAMNSTMPANDGKVIATGLKTQIEEMNAMGIVPSRVFAIAVDAEKHAGDSTVFSYGLSEPQHKLFFQLAQYLKFSANKSRHEELLRVLNENMIELFGNGGSVNQIITEKVGGADVVRNGPIIELLFWNYVRMIPENHRDLPLPEENTDLVSYSAPGERTAGIIFFAVPLEQVRGNLELLVTDNSDAGCELAISDQAGRVYRSAGFLSAEKLNHSDDQTVISEEQDILIQGRNCSLKILRFIQKSGFNRLFYLRLLLLIMASAVVFYVHRTLYAGSGLSRSVQLKLIVSIMLTALVPMLTVKLVGDSFVFQNRQALLHQQRAEMRRYLDSFEARASWHEQILARQLQTLASDARILAEAEKLDAEPKASEPAASMRRIFLEAFDQIDSTDDWSGNATARDAIIIGRNNWTVSQSRKVGKEAGGFPVLLSQLGRHILTGVSGRSQADSLKMQDLKGELFFDGAMRSIRSNFGDDAYIMLNSAFSRMVEFEITTGAALVMPLALPSISDPKHLLLWMVTVGRGGYLKRIARRNRGPFAVFSMDYARHAGLMNSFSPQPGLDLRRAAAWIHDSNLPVSLEQQIGNGQVSIEGRPGNRIAENFMIAVGSQAPVDLASQRIQIFIAIFLLFALLLFLFIGFQTASDIMLPVRALTEGMYHIGQQNYFYRINLERADELGRLCNAYDRFARGLAEKEIMGKMLSRSARQAAGSEAETVAGGRRQFVVMYIGSLDFASRLEKGSPAELFKELKDQVAKLCRIILEEGGDIDKLMGDKILGVFPADDGNALAARCAAINATRRIIAAEQA
ncbi:MAG TPA: HAMP domain-containing protein, partial [Candidatus Rifleibacterium sp.]|nr:HAMP domain-containing protein [Candidatus Rifleibacterium sp.]